MINAITPEMAKPMSRSLPVTPSVVPATTTEKKVPDSLGKASADRAVSTGDGVPDWHAEVPLAGER